MSDQEMYQRLHAAHERTHPADGDGGLSDQEMYQRLHGADGLVRSSRGDAVVSDQEMYQRIQRDRLAVPAAGGKD
jgi:hypothetical protein